MLKINSIKIDSVSALQTKSNRSNSVPFFKTAPYKNDIFIKNNLSLNNNLSTPRQVSFMGKTVHIVDGGNHATNMQHFFSAIDKSSETKMHTVRTNPKDDNIKQLESLEEQLRLLNQTTVEGEYIAIPALASVPILNIQDQYNAVMDENIHLTPENMKSHKKGLLSFLKKLYDSPSSYRRYISYMDPNGQGIEHTYGVIQQINALKEKGANVYVPSGHPQDETLKWMAGQRGLKPELYHFIATGEDVNGSVQKMHDEIKNNEWYDFNLLSLSNANIVGVKGAKGAQDYMFAAYDSCITDGQRGVYNFSPVRRNGDVIGYSYTDTITNEYPYEEFPANWQVENIIKFVGQRLNLVVADEKEIEELQNAIKKGTPTKDCADRLYPVEAVFSKDEIKSKKINLQGDYVNRDLDLFFRINRQGQVIFPKCDCEGSGKPSVLSMWGSCFAVFNAIARDINAEENNLSKDIDFHNKKMDNLINGGLFWGANGGDKQAEDYFNNAILTDETFAKKHGEYFKDYRPHYYLGNLHFKNQKYDYASACYNNGINILSNYLINHKQTTLYQIVEGERSYNNSKQRSEMYDRQIMEFYNKPLLQRLFGESPQKPLNYNKYKDEYLKYHKMYETFIPALSDMFEKLSVICEEKGEHYPAEICSLAALDIKNGTQRGTEILRKRAEGVQFIGDLYENI